MNAAMHIGLVGPIATADIAHLLDGDITGLPRGYAGAPLLATLIGALLDRGHRVSAFTLSNDLPLIQNSRITASGKNLSIDYCPMRPRAWRPNGYLPGRIVDLYRFERRALVHAITLAAPDVLHAHWTYEFAMAALATGIAHVITSHDSPYKIARLYSRYRPTISLYRWLRVVMARQVLRKARCVTAVSPYMRDEIQSITSARIDVVPNLVDATTSTLATFRTLPALPRVAMVCNGWSTIKNPQPALIAFSRLKQHRPAAELHLYGHDFGSGEVAQLWCRNQGISDGMYFHGAMSHRALLLALANDDLLLHPSIEESFGMVLAEAMAMGLPVVAGANSGAVPWVVSSSGILCDVRNAQAIEAAMLESLAPARYAELSRLGMANATERFSTTQVVQEFYSLYQLALVAQPSMARNTVCLEA